MQVGPKCEGRCVFSEVFIGKSKESLDSVDPQLVMMDVIPVFGHYVKYAVGQSESVSS